MELTNAALVLEGGGMRGAFTAGVLDYFLDNELMFDKIYGVSMGACHACSYISLQRERAFRIVADYIDDPRYMGLKHKILTGDWFPRDFVYDKIPNELDLFDYEAFRSYKGTFYSVLTDCRTGKAVYMPVRDLEKEIDIVRASASLPVFSKMVKLGNSEYLDGGMVDSIPVQKAVTDGNDKVVVVLTRDTGYVKEPSKAYMLTGILHPRHRKLSEAIKNRHIMYNNQVKYIERLEAEGKIFVIRPPEGCLNIGRLERDKEKLKVLYDKGLFVARERGEALKEYLRKDDTK